MDWIRHVPSPLGGITLASDGDALTGLWFDGQRYFAGTLGPNAGERALPVFREAERWLELYFGGTAPDFTPKLALRGTDFRRTVWEALLGIPWGRTVSYGDLAAETAEKLGLPPSSARTLCRAVGGAVGHNPVSLIVPCHRVVGRDGSLVGYAGGLERKRRLLALEAGTCRL